MRSIAVIVKKNEQITSTHLRSRREALVKGFKLLIIQPIGEHGNAVQDN